MRKSIFIGKLAWDLQHADAMEFEQYDSVDTVYVIAHENGQVLGGARLLRTDRSVGVYSYMIRDAYYRRLPGLPHEICAKEPPCSADVWELTRLGTNGRAGVSDEILRKSNEFLVEQKATNCLFLGSPAFMRIARNLAFCPDPMGPISGNKDGRFLAFSCPVRLAET